MRRGENEVTIRTQPRVWKSAILDEEFDENRESQHDESDKETGEVSIAKTD